MDILLRCRINARSSGVRKLAVPGRSISTIRRFSSHARQRESVRPQPTVKRDDPYYDSEQALDDLCCRIVSGRCRSSERKAMRTNIHDQPSRPPIPLMKEIPKASRPENAPARVAPAQKSPIRTWSICRGYHKVKLKGCQEGISIFGVNALIEYTRGETGLSDTKAYADSDQLRVAVCAIPAHLERVRGVLQSYVPLDKPHEHPRATNEREEWYICREAYVIMPQATCP